MFNPNDPRFQVPGYLEGEAARIRERAGRRGAAGLPLALLVVLLPVLLVARAVRFLYRKIRRRPPSAKS